MRVRFFEVGAKTHAAVLRCDEFPTGLGLDEDGQLTSLDPDSDPVCVVDDLGGQLTFRLKACSADALVNNAPLEQGPLLPGDQLALRGRRYVVSYERTADVPPPEPLYRSAYRT